MWVMPRTLAASVIALLSVGVLLWVLPSAVDAQNKTSTESTSAAWSKLSASQQAALKPMQADWAGLDANRKKKWLAVAQRFQTLSAADQARVHSRMQEWQKLSPAQRSQARDNYSAVLSSPNTSGNGSQDASSKATLNDQWMKYQALSPEKKAELGKLGNLPTPVQSR